MPTVPTLWFYYGPYDGLSLDLDDIQKYCQAAMVGEGPKERYFVLMPPLLEWGLIVAGIADKDGPFEGHYPYELLSDERGAIFCYCQPGEFEEAMDAAIRDHAS